MILPIRGNTNQHSENMNHGREISNNLADSFKLNGHTLPNFATLQ